MADRLRWEARAGRLFRRLGELVKERRSERSRSVVADAFGSHRMKSLGLSRLKLHRHSKVLSRTCVSAADDMRALLSMQRVLRLLAENAEDRSRNRRLTGAADEFRVTRAKRR